MSAHGIYDLGNISYSDILGAQGGGQSLANMMGSLGQMLMSSGEFGSNQDQGSFGAEYMGEDIGWGGGADTGSWLTDPYSFWESQYGPGELSEEMAWMGEETMGEYSNTQTPGEFGEWAEEFFELYDQNPYAMPGGPDTQPGIWGEEYNYENLMQGLGQASEANAGGGGFGAMESLLQSINLPGLQEEYGKDIGELRSEMGAQMKGLTSGLAGGKGGRYGGLGTSARNLGQGGRQKYMSDIYGLQQQQGEMTAEMQQGLEQDFMTAISNWQATQS